MSSSGKRNLEDDFGEFLLNEDSNQSNTKSSGNREIDLEAAEKAPEPTPLQPKAEAKSESKSDPPKPQQPVRDETLNLDEATVKIDKAHLTKAAGLDGGSIGSRQIELLTIKVAGEDHLKKSSPQSRENTPPASTPAVHGQSRQAEPDDDGSTMVIAPPPQARQVQTETPRASGNESQNQNRQGSANQSDLPVMPVAAPPPPPQIIQQQFVVPAPQISSEEAVVLRAGHLKVAQNRILELENELERIRTENERLASATDLLQGRVDELTQKVTDQEKKFHAHQDVAAEEKRILQDSIVAKDRELDKLRAKTEELESRLAGDLKKIRVRERELENRLELAKVENAALVRNKNEIILDLKRQIDHLTQELDNYKAKKNSLNQQADETRDRIYRAVKAMRLALAMLDGETDSEEDKATPLKKAE